jgi:hypothetical protein
MTQQFTVEELKKIHTRLILGETKSALNKEYQVHANYFSRQFHKLNWDIPRGSPRSRINGDYFNNINTEDKAYLLGVLFTDGYIKIPTDKYKHQHVIGLEVEETDKLLIEYFNSKLKPEGSLMRIACTNYGLTKKGIIPIHYRSTIYSDYLANTLLSNYNFCYSKSQNKNIELPIKQIPPQFIFSFIRGLIDGDGTVAKCQQLKNGDNTYYIGFTSCSKTACENLRDVMLIYKPNLKCKITERLFENPKYNPIYSLRIEKREDVLWLADKMYTNFEFCLERKLNRVKELCITTLNSKYKYESFVYDMVNRVLTRKVMFLSSAENRE